MAKECVSRLEYFFLQKKQNDLKSALKQFIKIVDTEKQLPRTEILLT